MSGGSWLNTAFMYASCSDDELLGLYQQPSTYIADSLQQLDKTNMGTRCTKHFSAQALSLQAVLLVVIGIPEDLVWQTLIGIYILKPYDLYSQKKASPIVSLPTINIT